MITLYDYFRSGAAYRTRIALNLKELEYDQKSIHLTKDGGEQFSAEYEEINPQNLVPTLVDGGLRITQSMAIIEYLEETYPEPALLPADQAGRTRVRALANIVACDIHPLNNLRVRLFLGDEMAVDKENQKIWIDHWIRLGFTAYEKLLTDSADTGAYCHGDRPGMAEACLIPQIANARLNHVDLSDFPTILKIDETCQAHPAFEKALPANHPDAT